MEHPNKALFRGVLTSIGVASDKSPSGGRGHRVLITKGAARSAVKSLVGMALNLSEDGKNHNARKKIGIIEKAKVRDGRILVEGYVWKYDFPEIISKIEAIADLGMSYEAHDAHVEDLRAEVWKITRITFTGACVLPRVKAAYKSTEFRLLT